MSAVGATSPKPVCTQWDPRDRARTTQTPQRKEARDNREPFSHQSPSLGPHGKPGDFPRYSITQEQRRAIQAGRQGLTHQPLAAPRAPSSRKPAGMGLWYATAPAVLRTADEAAAPQLPGDLQQPNNCLPAAAELG